MNRLKKYVLLARTRDLTIGNTNDRPSDIDEIYSKEQILPMDLKFTLEKDPTCYIRPIVRLKGDHKLEVVGHIPFFEGVRDAGAREVYIDLLHNGQLTDKDKKSLGLSSTQSVIAPESIRQFLFYQGEVPSISTTEVRARWPSITQLEINWSNQNLNFTIKDSPEKRRSTEEEFMNEYAIRKLRSICGIVRPSKRYDMYFTSPQV
jgi:hypothetical protein